MPVHREQIEALLHNVLEVSEESMESTACQVEHLLNEEVTEAVCTFLGHPPSCPHGRQVPSGRCCEAALATVQPLIVPLERCRVGETELALDLQAGREIFVRR